MNADFFIDEYFGSEKDNYILRVVESGGWELGYLPPEARNEVGVRELLDNWPSEADDPPPSIATFENTTVVEALKRCIGNYALDEDADFTNGRNYEYFAVLALWLVGDAMHWLRWLSNPVAKAKELRQTYTSAHSGFFGVPSEAMQDSIEKLENGISDLVDSSLAALKAEGGLDSPFLLSRVGDFALLAMDAVCYAEQLRAIEIQAAELIDLRLQLHKVEQHTEKLAEEKAIQKISITAKKAAIKRHAENYEMKEQVFSWCLLHLHEYSSMDGAAEAVAGNLVPVTFRTVRGWIGEYRKQGRSARRP